MSNNNIIDKANTLVVLDFETTGLSPDMGDRAIEIGAVKIENGIITAQFQQLMNPGKRISSFIENYTGITNKMLNSAPSCAEVMQEFAQFIHGYNLVAHNASFDKRFLDNELARVSLGYGGQFACSMLVSRRIYPNALNHQLGTLVAHANIQSDGVFHRALYDSQMTAKLWLAILNEINSLHATGEIPFSLVHRLSRTPKKAVAQLLNNWRCKDHKKLNHL